MMSYFNFNFNFKSPGDCYIPIVGCINHVLWLNGSDFVVEEDNEDITCQHPVPSQKHLGVPAYPKPVPNLSTDSVTVNIRTAYSTSPAFPLAQKNVSKRVRS
jgi:hypothetical protein